MAETSLARQLRKLATPQTSLLKETRKRVSFLFDPREAAALDVDTVYAIGLTGLEELCALNEDFARFEGVGGLFSEDAKFLERAVKGKQENAALDAQIKDFLLHLSPHFLLRPAHKALEWLVYRFHVHQYNVDALLRCVFPFHETRVFARALQLLDLTDKTSRWHWLHCLQKPGLSLTKTALITQCSRDPGMLKFICDLLVDMVQVHSESHVALRPAVGLYATTVLGTLEASKRVTDQTVAMLLPYVLKGLASSAADHRAATYLVVGQLARRSVLNREFARELLIRVAKSLKAESLTGGLLCLLVLMSLQGIEALPKASFQALVKHHKHRLVAAMGELAARHSVAPLLKPLMAQLTKSVLRPRRLLEEEGEAGEGEGSHAALLKSLVQLALSLDGYSDFVVGCFFDTYVDLHGSAATGGGSTEFSDLVNGEGVLDILKLLRQRCPDEVDTCLERHLSGGDGGARDAMERLTRGSGAFGLEHEPLAGSGDALFLALNSASKRQRVAAVREMVSALQRGQEMDDKFVRNSLRNRLSDTEPEVVQAVLALGKDLCNFVELDFLLSTLRRILFEPPAEQSKKWCDLRTRALAFVCADLSATLDEGQVLATVLPFLMPTSAADVSLARVAYASEALQRLPIFGGLVGSKKMTAALDSENVDAITELLFAGLSDGVRKLDQPLVLVKTLQDACFPSDAGCGTTQLRCICGCLLNALTSSLSSVAAKDRPEVVGATLRFYRRLLSDKSAFGSYESAVAAVRDGHFPLSMVVAGLTAVINGVTPVEALEESPSWVLKQVDGASSASLDLLTEVFETVADLSIGKGSHRSHFRQLLRDFFKVHCPSLKRQVHFLSGLWLPHMFETGGSFSQGASCAQPPAKTERLQSLSLALSVQLLTDAENLNWIVAEQSLVFLSVILTLLSPTPGIRELGVRLVEASLASSAKGRSGPHLLFKDIVIQAAEVVTDPDQLLDVVSAWNRALKKPNTLLALLNHSQVPMELRGGILQLVSRIDSKAALEAATKAISTVLGPGDERGVPPTSPLPASHAGLLKACFAKYESETVQRLADVEGAVETLERALRSTRTCEGGVDSVATIALRIVTRDLVKKLPTESQAALLDTLVDLALDTPPAVEYSAVLRALRKVCSIGGLLVEPLQRTSAPRHSPAKTLREVKKMRLMDPSEEQDPAQSPQWKRVLILLEMVQGRKAIEDVSLLVAPLYALLKRSLELGSSPHAEYLRQCVLTALQAHALSPPAHELASLVKCLRVSQSAQAQQLVLGLLNLAAREYPEEVLHNVTSVFTFMGASLLRQDDNYSFQAVMQTVETVVPALLQACAGDRKAESTEGVSSLESAVASVTRVFVGAFPDIPEHRRLPLFAKLAATLGATDHLWVLAAQMAEHHVIKVAAADENSTSHVLDFGLALCGQFEVPVQMQTATQLLRFAAGLPAIKDDSDERPSHPEVFDVRLHSDKQLQRFRLTVASFVANLLGSATFLGQVAELQGKNEMGGAESLCGECLSACLQFLQQVSRWNRAEKTSYQERSWQAVQARLHDVVHKVNGLLPSGQFVSMAQSLMQHSLASVRRSAMDMLNNKLAAKGYFTEEDTQSLLELVPMLLRVARGKSFASDSHEEADEEGGEEAADSEEELALNRQTALLSIKLLIRTLGPEHPDAFAEVYDVVLRLLSKKKRAANALLLSSALLCFAELCHSLATPTISHFGRLMPAFLAVLERPPEKRSDIVTLALVTALHRLVENLAPFLSAYMTTILVQVCTMHVSSGSGSGSTALGQRLESISTHLARHVPPRVLIPAVEESFERLSDTPAALAPLMSVLRELIGTMEKPDLKGHLPQLQGLVLQLLAYRTEHPESEADEVDTVEASIVGVVTSLSFKLSETTFRPFFYKVFNWAAVEDLDKNKVLTFYHLTEKLSEMLKSLFVLFAGVFVEHAADLLVATNSTKAEESYFEDDSKSCRLLNHVLATLTSCFHHGGKDFLTRDRTKFLLKPLINQVENELGGEEATQERVERRLVPCLANFAAGCEDTCRKEWHQKLLYQMRHSSARVRYTTLLAFREAVRKLGDDYLSLLPEAVPFLAELMEDESTEVEHLCQDVILEVEQILGEPLMKYF